MDTTIDEYALRPKRSYESDGIFDMMAGFVVLAVTFVGICESSHTWYSRIASLGLIFASGFLLPRGAQFLKDRFVYPRLGYISPRQTPPMRTILTMGIGSLILIWVLGWVYSQHDLVRLLHLKGMGTLVDIGGIAGIALIVHFVRLRFLRHLIVAGITILSTILLATSPLKIQPAFFLLSLIFSGSMIVAGAIPFVKLLRTPFVTDQEME